MTPSPLLPTRRLALQLAVCAATVLVALAAHADGAALLLLQVDGVKGGAPANPLGKDAFPLVNVSFSTDADAEGASASAPERFGNLTFTLPISAPAVALWQLAAQQREVPKASLAAVDPASGAIRYRVDLEQVVVHSMSFQALPKRDAAIGALTYQRIRIRYGEGDAGTTASWDRAKNAPWK